MYGNGKCWKYLHLTKKFTVLETVFSWDNIVYILRCLYMDKSGLNQCYNLKDSDGLWFIELLVIASIFLLSPCTPRLRNHTFFFFRHRKFSVIKSSNLSALGCTCSASLKYLHQYRQSKSYVKFEKSVWQTTRTF